MDDIITQRLTKTLHAWTTKHLYTGDQGEFRANVQLHSVTKRISVNSFQLYGKAYPLPTHDPYFVFSIPTQMFRGFHISDACRSWTRGDDYLNKLQTRLYVYDRYGKLLPLSCVYIKKTCNRTFVIIRKDAFLACTTDGIKAVDDMYLSLWINPHPDKRVTVTEWTPTYNKRDRKWSTDTVSAQNAIHALTDSPTSYNWVMVNGVQTPIASLNLRDTDYISVITEQDIFCKFTVTIDDNITGYESALYEAYREILHMPKELNPTDIILTHDLIDVIIRSTDDDRGLFQSRYDYRSVRQITHQDFSVDRSDVDSLRDTLHASTIYAEVIVRNPVKIHHLGGDVNYIRDLYRNDDKTIVSLLRGSYVTGMDFWQASHLEQSPYVSLIFTNTIKEKPSDDGRIPTLPDYISALGFYNTASVIDRGVEIGVWDRSILVATAPSILAGRTLRPYVFVNGRKINDSEMSFRSLGDYKIELSLRDKRLKDGDAISVLLKDYTPSPIIQHTVLESDTVVTPSTDRFFVFTLNMDGSVTPVSRSTSTYRTDVINGTRQTTFYPQMYQKRILVYNEDFSTHGSISLDENLQNTKSLVYVLKTPDGLPVAHYNSLDVFINGYWAVYGVDYMVYTDTQTGFKTLAISNRNYLDLDATGNTVEWYAYSDKVVTDDFDYIIDNRLIHKQTPYLFEPNVSEVYSEGIYLRSVADKGSYIQTKDQIESSVGEHVLRLPYLLYTSLPEVARLNDDARRIAISNFFKNTVPARPDQTILNKQHQVYSVWLHTLINDLARGNLSAVNDPDPVTFIKQFPTYNGLKEADPTLTRINLLERPLVSIAAAYTLGFPEVQPVTRAIIQKLVSLTLIRDMSSLGVTPV